MNQPSGSTTAERGGPVRAGDAFAGQVTTPIREPVRPPRCLQPGAADTQNDCP